MVAHAVLAVIAVLAVAGVGTAAATHVFSANSSGNIDLGVITPGQTGNVTATSSVHLANSTYYKFEMEKEDRIGSVFSQFTVSVSVNGHTYNISADHNDSRVLLNSGTYTFTVKLSYRVSDHVHDANVTKAAFLFLHPTGNDTAESSSGFIAADNSGQPFHNGTERIVLGSLTFDVSGNAVSSHDNGTGDSNRDSVVVSLP